MTRKKLVISLLTALSLFAASCGGESGADPGEPAPVEDDSDY